MSGVSISEGAAVRESRAPRTIGQLPVSATIVQNSDDIGDLGPRRTDVASKQPVA